MGVPAFESRSRRLPDFLLAGAPRCATTAVANALRRHPNLFVPRRKEIAFFDSEAWQLGLDWYSGFFSRAGAHQLCGEATPWYMASQDAAGRIAEALPAVRAIFILRDPIARAWSHYHFRRRGGREGRTFLEALRSEAGEPRERGATERPEEHRRRYLIAPGLYTSHLERWERHLRDRQIHCLLFDDLIAQPDRALDRMQDCLGVPRHALTLLHDNPARTPRSRSLNRLVLWLVRADGLWKRTARRLVGDAIRRRLGLGLLRIDDRLNRVPADKPPLGAAESELLLKVFAPEIERLAPRLGRDLSSWIDPYLRPAAVAKG